MDFSIFYKAIKELIDNYYKIDPSSPQSKINQNFFSELNDIINCKDTDESLKMTKASILFEGFYQHLANSSFKDELSLLRAKRWVHHFGTPTLNFLLSYKKQIDQTTDFFNKQDSNTSSSGELPWLISKDTGSVLDKENHVIADPTSFSRVESPQSREVTGIFTKTHNPFGGFTTTPCDPVSQEFIAHAALSAKSGGKVLEIGAAFGAATLEAISKGATVFCNDIDPENLAVVRQRYLAEAKEEEPTDSVTGDSSSLILVPGELPQELIGLPQKHFDAILICRVLHFFSGAKIDESLALLSNLLTKGGKIYIVCETPFLKNWQGFIPEFNKRVECKAEWPGEITEPAKYESSGRAATLPKFVHWITKEVLERSLKRAGFAVEQVEYINRDGQFPDDLLLPEHGKESVGAIGRM